MIETRIVHIADIALKFVQCPTGAFDMGSKSGLPLEQPIRRVTIDAPFWIATTPITQEMWVNVMSRNPSTFAHAGELPVDGISYDAAIEFCCSATARYEHRLVLPTEAQWEYACRAGTTTEYFWGSSESEAREFGWFAQNDCDRTHEVASLAANPWGHIAIWHAGRDGQLTSDGPL